MFDCIIIGGSFAGLSAAMQLVRARRSVLVLDSGRARNRFAEHSHGFFTLDGKSPDEIKSKALEPLMHYPTFNMNHKVVSFVEKTGDGFRVLSDDGEQWLSKALVLATGLVDELPAIPGLRERWGGTVVHCPYCHGYELRDKGNIVLASSEHSIHLALLLKDWGPTTLCTQDQYLPNEEQKALLDSNNIAIEEAAIVAIEDEVDGFNAVLLDNGKKLVAGAIYVAPKTTHGNAFAEQLGLETEAGPTGELIKKDAMGQTSVPGVFVAGDNSNQMHNATLASAAGVLAGAAAHRYLVFEYVG